MNQPMKRFALKPNLRSAIAFFFLSLICPSLCPAQTRTLASFKTITIRVKEGTTLGFDVSPDGRSIVFDLLGQLWLVPAAGGSARMLTDAVRDVAEDLDPSFSPDGSRVVFRGERNGRTGLWLLSLDSDRLQQLTQLSNPDGFDGHASWSPDGRFIAFARATPPDAANPRGRFAIMSLHVGSGTLRELLITGPPGRFVSDPVWQPGGKEIAFVTRRPTGEQGGRIWMVAASDGQARPITDESVHALFPTFSIDGRRLAYFAADSAGKMQIWVQEIANGKVAAQSPIRVTNHADVTPTRIRWAAPDGNALLYSADGRLWQANVSGGAPKEIPFTAQLSIKQRRRKLPQAQLPEPGQQTAARGFTGMALAPDGRSIGMLALGKFWIIPVDGGRPRAVADVPLEASSLAWSPDGNEVAWSAGVAEQEDLFATNVATGATRRVTALAGREGNPTYSPDGRHLAFVHTKGDDGVLRLIDAHASDVADGAQTRDLGSIGLSWTSAPQWSPESDGLLVSGAPRSGQSSRAIFVSLSGQRQTLTRFPDGPISLQWTPQHTIVFVRHDRLWEARFDHSGLLSEPRPMGTDAALYASTSRDGEVLFVSSGGLRLRSPQGTERRIGWPLTYTPPIAKSTLIRNVRVIDGNGGPATDRRDILIEAGRIKQITPAGTLAGDEVRVIDAAGRFVIPGLIDLHAHLDRPDLLPGWIYFGITSVRDQGASMAPLVAYRDAIAAGILPGPRIGYGGFQFYSDWAFDGEQWRGIEPERDPSHIRRAVDLAQAFGAQHIKTRTFRRWDINARMIAEAHRRGMRVTGHCSHLLPLIAAGMDAKEHIGMCEARGNTYMYDDLIQLFRAANVGVVPTISYLDFAVRLNEQPEMLNQDADLAPFIPSRESFGWMLEMSAEQRKEWRDELQRAREMANKLSRAGVTIGTGTDIWQIPTGIHMELEQLVAAGLSPAQAIHAGTAGAARILGAEKDLGTIEVGKWADLVFLDADPLADIRNTRRIWNVMQYGRLVDRAGVLKVMRPR
jgi:imidazolonepropionase-like amidohydrolase/Tol biopolymer transport system component